jgi:hypothetical protein
MLLLLIVLLLLLINNVICFNNNNIIMKFHNNKQYNNRRSNMNMISSNKYDKNELINQLSMKNIIEGKLLIFYSFYFLIIINHY